MVSSLSFAAVLALLSGLQDPKPHEQKGVDIRARVFLPFVSGDVKATNGATTGDDVDVESDLDAENPGDSGEILISAVVIPWLTIHAHYWIARFDGEGTVDDAYFFGGSFFGVGAQTEIDLQFHSATLMVEYNVFLYENEDVHFEFGLQAGVGVMSFELKLQNLSAVPGFKERERFTSPLPLVGFRARAEFPPRFAVDIRFKVMKAPGFKSADFLVVEISGEFQVFIYKGLYVGAGGHFYFVDASLEPRDDEKIEFDLSFGGPIVSIGYTF